MAAGSASLPSTPTPSEQDVTISQLNMGRARVIARVETWAIHYSRERLVALIKQLDDEGPSPIYDELVTRFPNVGRTRYPYVPSGRLKTNNPPLEIKRRPFDILFGAVDIPEPEV